MNWAEFFYRNTPERRQAYEEGFNDGKQYALEQIGEAFEAVRNKEPFETVASTIGVKSDII